MTFSNLFKELIVRYGSRTAIKFLSNRLNVEETYSYNVGEEKKEGKSSILKMLGHTEYVLFSNQYNSSRVITTTGEERRVDEYSTAFVGKYVNSRSLAWTQFAAQSNKLISDAKSAKSIFEDEKDAVACIFTPERFRAEWAAINEHCFDGKLSFEAISKSPLILSELSVVKSNDHFIMLKDDAKVSDYYDACMYGFSVDGISSYCTSCLYGDGNPSDDTILEYIATINGIVGKSGAYSCLTPEDKAKDESVMNGGV